MFELWLGKEGEVVVSAKGTEIKVNVAQSEVEAGLAVGRIRGPGEFEIGEVAISAVAVNGGVIYALDINRVRVGVTGSIEDGLDELGPIDILVTDSVKSVGIIDPKIVVPLGEVDKFTTGLKADVKAEKKLKIKSETSLPLALTIVAL